MADATLVVYNENDPALARTGGILRRQTRHRGGPGRRLKCPTEEEISREEYDTTIATPLRQLFDDRHWWTRSPDDPGAEPSSTVIEQPHPLRRADSRDAAENPRDAGLRGRSRQHATLAHPRAKRRRRGFRTGGAGIFYRAISGIIPNPYFRSYRRHHEIRPTRA